ncbi:hypothetical protein OIU84_028825 [Salix udensis]|uniref:Uncharacterized protein n=1 Tax=Salix udensis TaxID=889485 RepID=A0AAD6PAL5_9ROSI|nr:hypothetical protein OIU84_028825 [Salix udensis]
MFRRWLGDTNYLTDARYAAPDVLYRTDRTMGQDERYADIIDWAGGYGVPVYKDYPVMMDARGNEEVQNLSIALHPILSKNAFDAMLNGVEIFKLSKGDHLSGTNPGAYQDSPTSTTPPSATSSKPKLLVDLF